MARINRRIAQGRGHTVKLMSLLVGLAGILGVGLSPMESAAQIAKNVAAKSPWGPTDEIGTLNMMTDASRLDVIRQVASGKIYDLGVDLFIGMPICCGAFGDPTFPCCRPRMRLPLRTCKAP